MKPRQPELNGRDSFNRQGANSGRRFWKMRATREDAQSRHADIQPEQIAKSDPLDS